MYLEKIELQGFKSFALPTTLIFNKELTAIVGPNGSGKSNVADAIRWVLGEQSLKLLRGKKSDDVIFAGSDQKSRLGFSTVKIYLDNRSHRADIDYDEVILERTVNRDGESDYRINNTKARLGDIQLLLARSQEGKKSYSVIGQGMIDSLLTISAADRKDFFDEATGVKHYQLKKNQALHKLEQTEENLHQAELVLQELTPRLHTLSRQVKRLERKAELEKQLTGLQNDYYSVLLNGLNKELDGIRTKKNAAEKIVEGLSADQAAIQKKLEATESHDSRGDSFDILQKKLFVAQGDYNSLVKQKVILEGKRDIDLLKAGRGDEVDRNNRRHELEQKIHTLELRIKELLADTNKHTAALAAAKTSLTANATSIAGLEKELAAASHEPWGNIGVEVDDVAADYDELHALAESLTPDTVPTFKKRFLAFTTRWRAFLHRLKRPGKEAANEPLERLSKARHEHDRLRDEMHTAETALQLNERDIANAEAQAGELASQLKQAAPASTKEQITAELKQLEAGLKDHESAIAAIRSDIDSFNKREEHKKGELVTLQKQFRTVQYDLTIKNNELTTLKVELAKLETKKEDLEKEIAVEAPTFALQKTNSLNIPAAHEQIATVKKSLNIIGGIDTETINEYKEVSEKHGYLSEQSIDLNAAAKSLHELIRDLDKQINDRFQNAFKNINTLFTKYFKQLFNGGSAKLVLHMNEEAEDEVADPDAEETTDDQPKKVVKQFDYTIEIIATPPGKKVANIAMLSGGEKAMAAIALICSIIANNPPPFVVFDEVDAALDEANSIRFAEIISELTNQTQFITITHNRATMHHAKILYGVTMGADGISRLLSVNFEQADSLSA